MDVITIIIELKLIDCVQLNGKKKYNNFIYIVSPPTYIFFVNHFHYQTP